MNYTAQAVTYSRQYLSKEKFREWYTRSRSSFRDSFQTGRNRDRSFWREYTQGLRPRKMNLLADYYGPEDPGRNPALTIDKNGEGNRIKIIQTNGEQTDVWIDNRGPLRTRTWRDRSYVDVPREIQKSLTQRPKRSQTSGSLTVT